MTDAERIAQLEAEMARLDRENWDLLAENARLARMLPEVDSYACQRCGRRDGLDAIVSNEVWANITGGRLVTAEVVDSRWNLLCLWCIDDLCHKHGIEATATLHFAGLAVCGTSQSESDQEHVSRLVEQREACLADRAALLSLHAAAWPSGGWAAWLPGGWDDPPPGAALAAEGWRHFPTRETAEAAVLGAAREAQGKGDR